MTMDKVQLAVIVVTVAALVFVVYSFILLSRISRCTEEGVSGLKTLLAEVRLETQGFRFAATHLNGLIERATAAVLSLETKLKTPLPVTSVPVHSGDISVSSDFVEFAQDGIDMLHGVAETAEEKLPQWYRENRLELGRLLAQKNRMEKELDELRAKCHANECLLTDLRRKSHSADEAESTAARLHALNQRLLVDVREARRRQLEAEQKNEPMVQELAQVKARLSIQSRTNSPVAASEEIAAGNTALRQRIGELELSVSQLQARVQESEEALSRTLREKLLIEERFLQEENG